MQEQDFSSNFLNCLEGYRRNALLYKCFQAWRFQQMDTSRAHKRHLLALEYWSYQSMAKCFAHLKGLRVPDNLKAMSYSKGKYLIYWAAATLLPKKSLGLYKNRIDKLINLLIEYGKVKVNMPRIRQFVKLWESFLKGQYFFILRRRWIRIKQFKLKREENLKRQYFTRLTKLNRTKAILNQMRMIFKSRYFKKWISQANEIKIAELKHELAFREMRKHYLGACFYALKEYTQWRKKHVDANYKAMGFFYLRETYHFFQAWKNFTVTEKAKRENLATSSCYYRYKLYKIGFSGLKKYTKKMSKLRNGADDYIDMKLSSLKRGYFRLWRSAFINKIKYESFFIRNLFHKGFRAFKDNYLHSKKVFETTGNLISQHGLKWLRKTFSNWKEYTKIRRNATNLVKDFQRTHYGAQVKEAFTKWRDAYSESDKLKRKTNLSFSYYQTTHMRQYFSSWKNTLNNRKMKMLANSFHENNLLQKAFKACKIYLFGKEREQKKIFKACVHYDNRLTFNAWSTFKLVYFLLKEKMFKVEQYFCAMAHFARQKKKHRYILQTLGQRKLGTNYKQAFYYLKCRASQNTVKRKSKALAAMAYQNRIYTKVFKALKKRFIQRKKGEKLEIKHKKKCMKRYYSLWRSTFKLESMISQYLEHKLLVRQKNIFKGWRNYAGRNYRTKKLASTFFKKKGHKYLYYAFLFWKKFVLIKHQSRSLAENLVVKHYCNLQVSLLRGWKKYAQKQKLLKKLQNNFLEDEDSRIVARYLGAWLRKTVKARTNAWNLFKRKTEMKKKKLGKIFKAWRSKCKGKAIRARQLELLQEKKSTHLILKCIKGWNNYVNKKRVENELVSIKFKKDNKKLLKKCVLILRIYKNSNIEEKGKLLQIENNHKQIVLKNFFFNWCENFKDSLYDNRVAPLVQRYQKIVAFRLFRTNLENYAEERAYYRTLDKFAGEVAKKRAFMDFMERLAQKRIDRLTLEHKQKNLVLNLKKKRFQELVGSLEPSVERTHRDMGAVRSYVVNLYRKTFNKWKSYWYCKRSEAKASERIRDKLMANMKRKFLNRLSELSQESEQNKMKSRRHYSRKTSEEVRKAFFGWRKIVVHKRQLELLSDRYQESSRDSLQRNIFSHWYERVASTMRNRYLIGRILISLYMKPVGEAFNAMKYKALKERRKEENFDQIHEKYVVNLLKKSFDQWREIFTSRRFSSDDRFGRMF